MHTSEVTILILYNYVLAHAHVHKTFNKNVETICSKISYVIFGVLYLEFE